jgi:hypothetical protein
VPAMADTLSEEQVAKRKVEKDVTEELIGVDDGVQEGSGDRGHDNASLHKRDGCSMSYL